MSSKQQRIEVIKRAGKLLSDRKKWIRGVLASRAVGRGKTISHLGMTSVPPLHPDAKSFCALGALRKCAFEIESDKQRAEDLLIDVEYDVNCAIAKGDPTEDVQRIHAINDDKSPAARRRVLAAFCDAIRKLEKKK